MFLKKGIALSLICLLGFGVMGCSNNSGESKESLKKENGEEIFPNWSYARGNSVKDFILNGNSYTPMIMARTDLIKKVGGFDSVKMLQDHIFMLKMLRSFPRLISIKDKLYVHNIHSNERVSKKKEHRLLFIKAIYGE